jgi:RNA polymerase sigma-B factor
VPTITGEVLRHFRDRTSAIRVPRRLRALQVRIYGAGAELEQRNGRSARPSEIAERLGVDLEAVIEAVATQGVGRPGSLDETDCDGEGSSGRLRFGSALGLHEGEFDLIEYREALAPLLAALSERDRRILVLRFFDGLTQSEIGARVGISQMHVSRTLTQTLGRLRRQLMADGSVMSATAR